MSDELEKTIIEKDGDLLYTTLMEECCELAQACSKIIRAKHRDEGIPIMRLCNICEEIGDVELNISLIKKKLAQDYFGSDNVGNIDKIIQDEKDRTLKKLNDIFLSEED